MAIAPTEFTPDPIYPPPTASFPRDGDSSRETQNQVPKMLEVLRLVLDLSHGHHQDSCQLCGKEFWLEFDLSHELLNICELACLLFFFPSHQCCPERPCGHSRSCPSDRQRQQMWWEEGKLFQEVGLRGLRGGLSFSSKWLRTQVKMTQHFSTSWNGACYDLWLELSHRVADLRLASTHEMWFWHNPANASSPSPLPW